MAAPCAVKAPLKGSFSQPLRLVPENGLAERSARLQRPAYPAGNGVGTSPRREESMWERRKEHQTFRRNKGARKGHILLPALLGGPSPAYPSAIPLWYGSDCFRLGKTA